MWIERALSPKIKGLCESRPAILVTGARQVGKSSLLQRLFPQAEYVTLDREITADYAESNPEAFLNQFDGPVILDEIQYAPSLFRELKIKIDENRTLYGKWILSGSQRFSLMRNISESLAGRISIVSLETLCAAELSPYIDAKTLRQLPWQGGYPETWSNPCLDRSDFFEGYIQTYLERDLKTLIQVSNLRDFRHFIRAVSVRSGQLVNYSDMAKDVGVSQVTIKHWLQALEAGGLIYILEPFHRNIGKRLVKTPKCYFSDTGLLCHLLNIDTEASYQQHTHRGHVWENFVFCELIKTHGFQANKNLFFYRDQNAVEMGFVIENRDRFFLVEAKVSEKIDARKLNFKKIVPLIEEPVSCLVANSTNMPTLQKLGDFSVFNPTQCFNVFDEQ